jgi:aspartyl-tRNA(Asn)/glutamyl-tRNA(Gln) amidotransferase subunit B
MEINEKYETVIGLETHVELSTMTKMFCGCRLSFGARPNTCTCPVCLGHPGVLPVVNGKAVEYAIKIALALNCTINSNTIFHRKNYFYPDMPKNYQISQYDFPIGSRGYMDIDMESYTKRVNITRVHMEEDTGKLIHTGVSGRISESESSIVDFNRAGTPLIEIVTEPDLRTPGEAKEFLINLRNLLLYLDVSDCSMEQGSLRCDANISVREKGADILGTKTEIKNMNSFRFLFNGLEYESKRQIKMLSSGGNITQQTRHYDHLTDSTKALRAKEEAHDYRYFPDPDLVPISIDGNLINQIKNAIPELPFEKAKRYSRDFSLPDYDCRFIVSDKKIADYFDKCMNLGKDLNPKTVSNWLMGDFASLLNKQSISIEESKVTPESLVRLIRLIDNGKINQKIAKTIFEEIFYKGTDPEEILKNNGMEQLSDTSVIEEVVNRIITENPDPVTQFRGGKEKAIGFLIGKVMAETKGKANPKMVSDMIMEKLKS